MKKILVAISDSFPYGAAYAARTRALCKLFKVAGFETDVLCDYLSDFADTEEFGNIYCISKTPYSGFDKLFKLPRFYANKMEELIRKNKYDYIVSRSMFDRFGKVMSVARKYDLPIILESCEWYDVRGFRRGKADIRYHQFQHCFRKTYNRVDGVIAISRLLEQHYKDKGIPVVRIPGIHDVDKLPFRLELKNRDELNLIFGGNVFGGKEQFSELLVAIDKVRDSTEKRIFLHIYGSSEEEIVASLDDDARRSAKTLSESIVFHGRVSQAEMAVACKENDFGVFFRPDRRSSHAGFPTKLGEYLAAGTPLITNDTGDISLVLENEKNGYMVKDMSAESICAVLEKCLSLTESEYLNMRKCARQTAVEQLNYNVYDSEIKSFFNGI